MNKKILHTLFFNIILSSLALANTNDIFINQEISKGSIKTQDIKRKILKNIRASYGLKVLGPSLAGTHQDGATYNRYNSGQDWKNDDLDATSSQQIYHAFSLGYQVTPDVQVYYSKTFQDDYNDNIQYETYNADGSIYKINERETGISHNNERINAFITNIYSNQYFFVMANIYYEIPTSELSKQADMQYGIGIQPTIGIFSSVYGLYHGLRFSLARDYYKRQEYEYKCGGFTCNQKYQTSRQSISAYIGYNITDKLNLNMELSFDWDQKGDQAQALNEFNKNMDDIIEIGPNYSLTNNIYLGARVQYALTNAEAEKSALIGTMNLSL